MHIKECTPDGEELVKIGKLNLVDLAGSENIGRSGAKEARAKEAGMINQSLLTLGRVINALVDRSPHIPYRESRLTRLLQDSLGGKTMTCIIANVSPAKCNIEESISTLDYAHRAKNIRNKPEINQKMTKRALIREYVTEIERLKLDLAASREKNGIFLTQETYDSLVVGNEGKSIQILEFSRSLTAKEEQLSVIESKLKQTLELLEASNTELKSTRQELDSTRTELTSTVETLSTTRQDLINQHFFSLAHASSEKRLDNLASTLSNSLNVAVEDIDSLYNQISEKDKISNSNRDLVALLYSNVTAKLKSLDEQFQSSIKQIVKFENDIRLDVGDLMDGVDQMKKTNIQLAKQSSVAVEQQGAFVQDSIASNQVYLKNQLDEMNSLVNHFVDELKNSCIEGSESFKDEQLAFSDLATKTAASVYSINIDFR